MLFTEPPATQLQHPLELCWTTIQHMPASSKSLLRKRFLVIVTSISTSTVFYIQAFSPFIFAPQIIHTQLLWKPKTTICFAVSLEKSHVSDAENFSMHSTSLHS